MDNEGVHKLHKHLVRLGVCSLNSLYNCGYTTRDRDDVTVLHCKKSGIFLLDKIDVEGHYNAEDFSYWGADDIEEAKLRCRRDDARRSEQFKSHIVGKEWLDVGTGCGGILDLLSHVSASTAAVEMQKGVRKVLRDSGYKVFPTLEHLSESRAQFDVVTLFHVFEHMEDPEKSLKQIHACLRPGGKLILEVPHARDFLISLGDCAQFKAFTFWSQHVILYTRQVLEAVVRDAGFVNITIEGFQRYPLANHLHWLSKGKPGGHDIWSFLSDPNLDKCYASRLAAIDATDTLILYAKKE